MTARKHKPKTKFAKRSLGRPIISKKAKSSKSNTTNLHVVRGFNPVRKGTHWGKRKLKREE